MMIASPQDPHQAGLSLSCRLPASALQQVEVKAATGTQVVVLGSFTPSSFTAINNGVSTLQIKSISTKRASLQNGGYWSFLTCKLKPCCNRGS
jgi:hypothetical protein